MFLFSHIQSQNWHYNNSLSVTSHLYTMELLICISELMSYFGASQSGVIAWRLIKMENLTILNKMLLIYFSLDFVFGTAEAYFLSKLFRERLEKHTFSSGMKNIYIFSIAKFYYFSKCYSSNRLYLKYPLLLYPLSLK